MSPTEGSAPQLPPGRLLLPWLPVRWLKEGTLEGGCVAPQAPWPLSTADEMLICVCVYTCVRISIYGLQKVFSRNTVLLDEGRVFMTVWFSGELCAYFTTCLD